jgi:hypothetical protein
MICNCDTPVQYTIKFANVVDTIERSTSSKMVGNDSLSFNLVSILPLVTSIL